LPITKFVDLQQKPAVWYMLVILWQIHITHSKSELSLVYVWKSHQEYVATLVCNVHVHLHMYNALNVDIA